MSQQPVIGFIGVGLMGGPMSLRLVQAGYQVWVWNRSREKIQPVVDAGGHAAADIADLTRRADIVMTCLTDTEAVSSVVFG